MSETVTARLARQIRLDGPISISRFMAEAVGHYYASRDPFGSKGDFTTAPEISQMFGELLGLWAAQTWLQMGSPSPVLLVELGPGRGTLMADALRAARALPAFRAALRVHLVETSPALRARQAATLAAAGAAAPTFHDGLESLPDGPALVIANEFFDALPIRQVERRADGWHERLVDIAPDGGFRFVLTPAPLPVEALLAPAVRAATVGSVAEICPSGRAIAGLLGARLAAGGGAALIVDYGTPVSAPGDSLQALRHHGFHPPLQDPGSADITAHVDFAALAEAAREAGAAAHGPVPQGLFLDRLGIRQRAATLCQGQDGKTVDRVRAALHRLTDSAAMGTLFQVLALSHPGLAELAGFAPSGPPGDATTGPTRTGDGR